MKAQPMQRIESRGKRSADVSVNSPMNSLMLMMTSAVLLHVAIQDGSPRPWIEWTDLLVTILLAALGYWLLRLVPGMRTASVFPDRHRERTPRPSTLVVSAPRNTQLTTHAFPSAAEFVFLLIFASLPLLTDICLRRYFSHGNPLEIQVTLVLRNLMFGMVVLPKSNAGRLAIFTSLFLAIYAALVAVTVTTNVLLATYALLGLWWLMGNYWQRISAHFPDETTTEIPYFARVGAVLLVLFCLAGGALAFQSSSITTAISGFLPSSGGAGGADLFARGGVGDGDQMVGGTEDASSFGPVESQLFLESKQPTLYDMMNENYDPPNPRKRKRSRAIPLSSQEKQKQNHTKLAQNKKATREFSAIRRRSKERKRKELDDTKSIALLYVAGRTPVHLALATFDHWDGQELSQRGEQAAPTLRLEARSERNWAIWSKPSGNECLGEAEQHKLKIINLNSATIPAPPTMTALHVDKLHDARFFQWEDGLLRVQSEKIPSLSVLHVESRPLRRDRLEELELHRANSSPTSNSADRPEEALISTRLHELATNWTLGAGSDWQRVEKICEHLRTFEHDPETRVLEEASDAVEHFLFESQRGPDYLFATSAAVLLRSLGYQTRVISGFYVDPTNYDRMAKATGVYAGNVHFWAEVKTATGDWVAVEPTPGFQTLYARQTLLDYLSATAVGITRRVLARPVTCSLVAFAMLGVIAYRSRLYAWVATCWWMIRLNTSPRQQVLRSVQLLQRLTRQRGSGRQTGQTLDQWISALGESVGDKSPKDKSARVESPRGATVLADFRSLVSWACYASSERPAVATTLVRQTCVDSVRLLKQRA